MSKRGNHPSKDTKVQQGFAEETKLPNIVRKFSNGAPILTNGKEPMYMDISEIPEYHIALSQVMETNQKFAKLPSKIRAEFQNSPSKFVEFCSNPENLERAEELGIVPEGTFVPPSTPIEAKTPEPLKEEKESK